MICLQLPILLMLPYRSYITLNAFVNGSIIWQFQIFIIMESIHSWCDDIKINVSWPTDLYRWAMMIRAKNSIIKTDLMILFACFNQMWECIEVHWWKQWYFNFWQIKVNYLFLLKRDHSLLHSNLGALQGVFLEWLRFL